MVTSSYNSAKLESGNVARISKIACALASIAFWIRRYVGSNEFINGIMRYCLWLKDCPPNELRKMPRVLKRVEGVRDFRLASKKAQTRRRADTPTLFAEDRFIDAPALFMPMVSSVNRRYIPMGFIDA